MHVGKVVAISFATAVVAILGMENLENVVSWRSSFLIFTRPDDEPAAPAA